MVEVVDYANIEETILNLASPTWDTSNNSNIPWINSPMIDAAQSVTNIPVPVVPPTTPDLVWWSTDIVFTADDYNTVSWSTWSIKLADWTSYSISSTGNTWNMTAITYVYYDWTTTLKTTTTPQTAVWANKIMVAVCKKVTNTSGKAIVQPFGTVGTDVFITADNIAANTITANQIASNTITATQISSSYVYAGTINADNITSWTITGRTLQTGTTWQRVVISSANNRIDFYNTDSVLSWQITWWKVWSTQVLALSSSWYIYSWATHLTQHLYPLSDASYDLWASSLWYNNLYLNWTISFDSWDWVMSEVSWYPKWSANGSSTYYIPLLTWASTNKTTNASIIMNFGWTSYYINVLAV